MKTKILCMALLGSLCMPLWAQQVFDMTSLGVVPGKKTNMSPRVEKHLIRFASRQFPGKRWFYVLLLVSIIFIRMML